jgi:hypothetical protein
MRTILIISLLSSVSYNIWLQISLNKANKYNLKHDIVTYALGSDDGFKIGWKTGIMECQTGLRQTKDLTNRDKVLYWNYIKERADSYGIKIIEK